MAERSVITGRIVDMATGVGIAGLRVEALDAAGLFRDLLGYARTDADGGFRMEVLTADLAALVGQRAVTASLRVLYGLNVLADTRASGPKWPLDGRVTTVAFRVSTTRPLSRLPALLPFVVSGTAYDADGPVAGATVELYDRHPVTGLPGAPMADGAGTLENAIGTTDARGNYRITYSPPEGKDLADLVVRVEVVVMVEEIPTPITTDTDVRCHAPPSLVVNVVQDGERWRGPSTHTRTRAPLAALSSSIEVPIRDFTPEQLEHIACSSRLPLDDVLAVALAEAIAHASPPLEAEVIFAALVRGMGTARDSFFLHPKSAVRQALTEAVAANQIPQRYGREGEIDAALGRWVEAAAVWTLEARTNPCGLGELLTVAGVAEAPDRTSFAQQLCGNEAAMPAFWDGLTGTFDKPRIQLTFQWWSLARGHLPLIEELEARRAAPTEVTLLDLAKFSEVQWRGILDELSTGAPPTIPGDGDEQRKDNYAKVLYATMATAFPTKVFAHRVDAHEGGHPELQGFFVTHPEFEFGKDRLSKAPYKTTVDGMISADDRKRIQQMERLFRIAPTYEVTAALIEKGYTSANAIHTKGKKKFEADMGGVLDPITTAAVLTYTCWQVSAASTVLARFGQTTNRLEARGLPTVGRFSEPLATDIPDWQTLFGNAGGCSCKHCAGMLGPAAYLADSLVWLERFDSEEDKAGGKKWSALDILVGAPDGESDPPSPRRPDIKLLELTCKSAHTPQPYIDLVNELLELAVAEDASVAIDSVDPIKTTFEPEELAAGPEILYEVAHIGAWRSLMARRHPFTLPVCLFDRESEAYLGYLGVTRADIVETLGGNEDNLAKARLGVRDDIFDAPANPLRSGWKMLLGTDGGSAAAHWGLPPATILPGTLPEVPMFLRQSGLTFTELEELLATRYVNGDAGEGAPGLDALVLTPVGGCDTAEMTLPALDEDHLHRIHRFLRLRLHTGLSSTDLDLLMAAFWTPPDPPEPMEISADMLHKVTGALALAKELKLSVREVAGLFADLDIHERWEKKSPYRQYFLNRLVESPEPAVFADVLAPEGSTASLTPYKTVLQQALGLSEKDLKLLVDEAALGAELLLPPTEIVVNDFAADTAILPRVSELWRHVRFARALGLRLADYLVLRAYSGLTPIGVGADLADARAFVDLVRTVQAQKLTVADLQWILRAFAPSSTGLSPHAADIEALRVEIASALQSLESETEGTEDPAQLSEVEDGEDGPSRVFALLDQLLEGTERDEVMAVLRGSDTPPDGGAWRDKLEPIAEYLPGDIDSLGGAKDLLAGPLNTTPHPDVQLPPLLKSTDERFAYAAKWLDRHIRGSRIVTEKVAAATGLSGATITYLVTTVLKSQVVPEPEEPPNEHPLIADFLLANKPGAGVDHQTTGLGLVLRHARLLAGLRLGEPIPPAPDGSAQGEPGELSWVYSEPPVVAEPTPEALLRNLPAAQPSAEDFDGDDGDDDRTRFAQIIALVRRVGLRDRMSGGPDALREYFDALRALIVTSPSDLAGAQSLLAEKTGWDLTTITALCDEPALAIPSEGALSPEDLLLDANLLRLEKAVALVRRLGIDPAEVLAFSDLEALPPAAEENGLQPTTGPSRNARDLVLLARRAAKAKLSAEQWQQVAKKIRDPFRELLRDRLVDALVPGKHATRNDLYGFHLIDVDMNACMMTSRIVQATNAMQIFVQRSFLALDEQVKLPDQAGKEWQWRSTYRVWEANRKVFLWPENWLEPELRDDITPLFRDFLTNLSSGEITDASAERALEKYLTGLHEIARLEPMALWYDYEAETDHVVARTRSQPRKWFYRRREGNTSWTAWEKMDVDIDAESALLVGANRRIYLLWPQITLKSDPRIKPATPKPGHPGLVPLPELGESDEDYAKRFEDYRNLLESWGSSDSEPEATYHYEVGVAWSSYMDGAWTSRMLSDCTPLRVSSAKGDGEIGYEPYHIVFVAEPKDSLVPQGAVHVACIVTASSFSKTNNVAGRFYFDACGGGRWTSRPIEGQVYHATQPMGSTLSRTGFRELNGGGGGGFRVSHVPPGKTSLQTVPLLGGREGRFFIVSPSRYGTDPTHTFDRFLFADHKVVFHGRALAPTGNWTAASSYQPGEFAGVGDAGEMSLPPAILGGSGTPELAVPTSSTEMYELELFEHPQACEFANRLAAKGAAGLLGWKETPAQSAQYLGHSTPEYLSDIYQPTAHVAAPFPSYEVSFDFGSAYGMYNWELFFHVPFTIAQRLSQEGRHAEAQKWFHFIFNPTSGVNAPGPQRFWCFRPFHEIPDLATIGEGLAALAAESSFVASLKALVAEDETTQKAADEIKKQIKALAAQPFAPHVLARMRPLAYMKNVFMRYLQNLLDWADSLFRRDTMESIHEALTLYLLAADLLGPRPEVIEHKEDPPGKTFKELFEAGIDEFGNAAVNVEAIVPKQVKFDVPCNDGGPALPSFSLYFCVPLNDHLYGAWDMVADRLFKIRNCMNIDGVVRTLALFAPPIDPALLVKATAAGVSLDDVLNSLAAPAPLYRFLRLHAKAMEFAGAVQSLGQAALAAWERKDGEELALLRQRQEREVLEAERELRKQAIQEAKETLAGLNRSRESAEARLRYYTELLDKGLLQQEKAALASTLLSTQFRAAAALGDMASAYFGGVPDTAVGLAAAVIAGGRGLQAASGAAARRLSFEADKLNTAGSLAQTMAGYTRRAQEWKLQKSVGEKEVAQLDKQIIAQEIRLAMAERELDNLDLRREHSREIDSFFRSKFTNRELYTWMTEQVGAEHYRAYQTAYDMAKRAERAYQLERGDDKTFIQFGAWDSLKKGLLAGERLLHDLRALDAAYLSRSDREREITKHVALSEIAGEQLTQLRDTGEAVLDLHTYHFDADYPGHYFRRIKTVAISVATVKPPADGVQCELTLLQSSIRKTSQTGETPYPGEVYGEDPAHRYSLAAVKGLVTSTGENDPGLFELSLKDEMLLPFEGSGVVSQWRIAIDPKTNRFPLHRISDVMLHLRYTAKDGGAALRGEALAYAERTAVSDPPNPADLPTGLKQRTRVFSAKSEFAKAWALFVEATYDEEGTAPEWVNRLELRFVQSQFRSFFGNPKVKIVKIQVSATFNEKYDPPSDQDGSVVYTLTRPPAGEEEEEAWWTGSLPYRAGEPLVLHTDDPGYVPPEPPALPDPPPLSVEVKRGDDESLVPWIFKVPAIEAPEGSEEPPAYCLGAEGHYLLRPDAFEDIWFTVTYEARP